MNQQGVRGLANPTDSLLIHYCFLDSLTFPLLEGFILSSDRKEVKPCENCYKLEKLRS
jgi:hypothetical protein